MSETGPDEPLHESAPLAWAEAPRRCHDRDTPDACMWYHRVWQYLRLLGVITTIRTNTGFLISNLRACARTGRHRRVLISATADYSMLAHLRYAYALENQALEIVVVDRCDTPLFLNRWYADHCRFPLVTTNADILGYESDRPFDLICSHNFLGRFDGDARRRLIARWHDLLRPGGIAITAQRIRPNDSNRLVFYTEEQARALGQRVEALARASSNLRADPGQLGEAVYQYALRKGGYVIRTHAEITDPFLEQGFEIHLADNGGDAERQRDRPSSMAGTDTYRLRIVATRL